MTQETKKEIMQELWERLPDDITSNDLAYSSQIEPHISTALDQAIQQERELLIQLLHNRKRNTPHTRVHSDLKGHHIGYNQAINDIITLISK